MQHTEILTETLTETQIIDALITNAYDTLLASQRDNPVRIQMLEFEFQHCYHELFDNFDQFIEMATLYDILMLTRDMGLINDAKHALEIIKTCHPNRSPEITTELMSVYGAVYEQRANDALVEIEKNACIWTAEHYFQTGNSTLH